MKNKSKISSLSNVKARNLMRGIISNKDPMHALRALDKIRVHCSESEFRQALMILRGSEIFTHNPIGREFNKKFPRLPEGSAVAIFSPHEIVSKVEENIEKAASLLNGCVDVLESISKGNLSAAVDMCRALLERDGASIALLRYLHFIKNHSSSDRALVNDINTMLNYSDSENVRYISSVIKELSSGKTDYFNITDRVLKSEWSIGVAIARTFIDMIPRSQAEFSSALSSLYYVSLLDACIYLARLKAVGLSFVPALDRRITDVFSRASKFSLKIEEIYENNDLGIGLDLFREAFLLFELDDWFSYRAVHASLFNSMERKEDQRTVYEREILERYFASINRISEIGGEARESSPCLRSYCAEKACHFQNSTALVYLLERSDGDIDGKESDFVELMSRTRDIGVICPQSYIESMKAHAESSELKIVTSALSHIKQPSHLKEHELRAVLQESARNFSGKYTKLLDYIYEISPAVAEHLVHCSDETFLSKMFQIMKNPNAAIEERASILEWYGEKVNDASFLDRAKNLRIDVQISKERGTIDDSRIYVDPVKFTQWVNDQVLDQFAILLESLPQPVEPVLVPLAWDKVKTGIGPYEQMASLILQCYEEFCSNKVYGIASYLGRRIRHGTLKGTGYNDVAKFYNDKRFSSLFLVNEFKFAYEEWLLNYEANIDELRDKYLYVRSKKKPNGLIITDLCSVSKKQSATHLLYEILKSFSVNKSCAEVPYLIIEFCWRIIEEDLSEIRKIVMEKKSQCGVFRASHSFSQHCQQRDLQDFCQELNSIAAERFRTIELWFNKPSIASPSANIVLLFKAVVSEIKSHFLEFQPELIVDDLGFMLNGGAYHVIYDALFILIYNAAENGKKDGSLGMELALSDIDGKRRVDIKVISQVRDGDDMACIKESINLALEGDCEDALILEGRSGIKKLRRMEQDGYIQDVCYSFPSRSVEAKFSFGLEY